MSRRLILLFLVLSLVLPAAAVAGKKPLKRKPLQLDPLGAEIAAKGEFTDDQWKTLRVASRCLDSDRNWQREQERPGTNVPVHSIYELLSSAVVCWQGAEKKAVKAGEAFAPTPWVVARARYLEAYRSFMWAIIAKLEGERERVCGRLDTAKDEASAAITAAAGLADKFETTEAKEMGFQLDQEAQALGAMIEDEYRHQKCK